MKTGFKSLSWLVLIAFFGLLQLWMLLGYEKINTNFQLDLKSLTLDGVFLFFSTAIVTSMTVDYYFDRNLELSKLASGFLFSLFPGVIVFLTSILYWFTYTTTKTAVNVEFVIVANQVIMFMSLIYCLISKVLLFNCDSKDGK